ncbi:MAG: hypothetical protein J2P43_09375 [Candidatus Dormibacteraeota bacterium]|nr:hypothetical protein [Candidatus Dormibacteraeota bacterium]
MTAVLLQAGEMDELQTIFYLALVIGVMLIFIFIFLGIGLTQWVSLLREGEHPLIAGIVGFTLIGALVFIVVTAGIIVNSVIAQKACLRC